MELLLAIAVVTMLAGSLAGLASGVHSANRHARGRALATQHARVALLRIEHAVRRAQVSPEFPGCLVVSESEAGHEFPDSLVVWSGEGGVNDPTGLPRWSEVVVYAPDPRAPERLVEFRAPGVNGTVPATGDAAGWRTALRNFKSEATTEQTELTHLLRTASTGGLGTARRGCVRFEVTLRPGDSELVAASTGALPWEELNWVRDLHGPRRGTRQVWCGVELQLTPPGTPGEAAQIAIPFFGSAAIEYSVEQ